MDYPATGPDGQPPMPDLEQFINREVIFSQLLWDPMMLETNPDLQGMPIDLNISGEFDILDSLNPNLLLFDLFF